MAVWFAVLLLQQPRTTLDASKRRLLCAHVQRQIAGRTFVAFHCHVARRPSFHPCTTLVGGLGDDFDEFCGDIGGARTFGSLTERAGHHRLVR